jgi:protein TonB
VAASKKPEPPEERKRTSLRSAPKPAPVPQQAPATAQSTKPGLPGYVLGSLTSGFVSEHDVRIAIPTLSPDPPITRAKLPEWIRGDVIVEITISDEGAVTETKVLQTVGYGLEDTIVETLRRWRFTPAVVDGVAVASRQDVHFHFPS